jgi:hypothetical protein
MIGDMGCIKMTPSEPTLTQESNLVLELAGKVMAILGQKFGRSVTDGQKERPAPENVLEYVIETLVETERVLEETIRLIDERIISKL